MQSNRVSIPDDSEWSSFRSAVARARLESRRVDVEMIRSNDSEFASASYEVLIEKRRGKRRLIWLGGTSWENWAGAHLGRRESRRADGAALEDVDLDAGSIRVERSWDMREGLIDPKSRVGRRSARIASVLREYLAAHALRSGRRSDLMFGRTADWPFAPTTLGERAATAWKRLNAERKDAEVDAIAPIGLHERRHTFASLMIAAGVNAKALSTYMGHSTITITLDRYGT